MNICLSCAQKTVKPLLNLGLQPISNRFLKNKVTEEFKHPLLFGHCFGCGLSQLIDPAPVDQVIPRFEWIQYNEAEGHLDDMVNVICELPNINPDSVFTSLSNKEKSTLERLNNKGFSKTIQIDLQNDLKVNNSFGGIETLQQFISSKNVVRMEPKPNVVIARHILEHAHKPVEFIQALNQLVHPNGYVVFEVPDNTRFFENDDYSILWEEHILYFTPFSFVKFIERNGFTIHSFQIYPYSMENSLVIIASPKKLDGNYSPNVELSQENARINRYAERFLQQKQNYQKMLAYYHQKGKKVALLGAGHLAAHFINLMEVRDYIDFVVDDNPNKKGLFMPGSQLPIFHSKALEEHDIDICLLSLNSESEKKVINNKKDFVNRGGKFFSIFPTSDYALKLQ